MYTLGKLNTNTGFGALIAQCLNEDFSEHSIKRTSLKQINEKCKDWEKNESLASDVAKDIVFLLQNNGDTRNKLCRTMMTYTFDKLADYDNEMLKSQMSELERKYSDLSSITSESLRQNSELKMDNATLNDRLNGCYIFLSEKERGVLNSFFSEKELELLLRERLSVPAKG